VRGCLFRGLRDDRNVKPSTDYFCDVSNPHSLLGDCMIAGFGRSFFQHEPVETGGIESM
jgi:hypothetical protein